MDAREQRGMAIAATCNLAKKSAFWVVPSQSGNGKYYVYPNGSDGKAHCTCPDHELHGGNCKHIYAVQFAMKREVAADGTVTETKSVTMTETIVRKTYPQDWPRYNAAQVNEKANFRTLLHAACSGIVDPNPQQGAGRRKLPLTDAIFSACYKVYSTVSGRRFMSDLRDAHESGYIGKLPCYSSIFNVLESEETGPILAGLVQETARPLKSVESHFSCDSSGFGSSRFERWFDQKYGGEKSKRIWVKCHLMCGTKTNIVTAVEMSESHDSPMFPGLLETTRKSFDVKALSADMAYSSVKNLELIVNGGSEYLIPFKCNAKGVAGGPDGLWSKMFHYFSLNREEFLSRYHQRSNVESTFSMIKAKFGDSVRSKTDVAMRNDVLAKVVCHNICCLNSAIYELGINPNFWAERAAAQQIGAV